MGFLGNKSTYKTLQRCSHDPVQNDCRAVWSKAGLGEGSKDKPDGTSLTPRSGQGHRAITVTDGLHDPGESQLGFTRP